MLIYYALSVTHNQDSVLFQIILFKIYILNKGKIKLFNIYYFK